MVVDAGGCSRLRSLGGGVPVPPSGGAAAAPQVAERLPRRAEGRTLARVLDLVVAAATQNRNRAEAGPGTVRVMRSAASSATRPSAKTEPIDWQAAETVV